MGRIFCGKTVLITGASSGFGAACATAFAKEGARLVILARRKERLEPVQNLRSDDLCAKIHYKSSKNFRHID